jgi:hypothetical protein
MKRNYLALLVPPTLFAVIVAIHYPFADKGCQRCTEFVTMTHGYMKSVPDSAVENPKPIPEPVEQYSQHVLGLFNSSKDNKYR